MAAKIQIKNDSINSFGGIFFIINQFRSSGLAKLIDKVLGSKGINTKFSYSNVVENLTSIFVSGGEVLEDVNFFRQEAFKANPDYRFCSADTIGRDLRGLAVANTEFQAVESGKTYQFNINDRLNDLLLKSLLGLGMVEKDAPVIFDYDNQFIPTEKYDATYSYKKANGYFPGIAQINLHPFCIENRDGNANVKFEQAETLERAFAHLKANGIKVDKARMDFGWKHLPFSFMKENTVFMILTALIRNFYVWLVGKIAANKAFGLEATSRVKKFVFRFVQVPFRWVFRSRQWHLQLFTSRPYDRLRL